MDCINITLRYVNKNEKFEIELGSNIKFVDACALWIYCNLHFNQFGIYLIVKRRLTITLHFAYRNTDIPVNVKEKMESSVLWQLCMANFLIRAKTQTEIQQL